MIENIPSGIKPVVTEHVIHGYWCRKCRKTVEPVVTDALPKSSIGLHTGVLSSWLHYQLGSTLSQILDIFNDHLRLKLTAGGLIHTWNRIGEILRPWYVEIHEQGLRSAVLNADETGWRLDGKTHWLWCFTTKDLTYYEIDQSRGSVVLRRIFCREYQGVLWRDFFAAYNAVYCKAKQRCLPHLLRDLKRTDKLKRSAEDWPEFILFAAINETFRIGMMRPASFPSTMRRYDREVHQWHSGLTPFPLIHEAGCFVSPRGTEKLESGICPALFGVIRCQIICCKTNTTSAFCIYSSPP